MNSGFTKRDGAVKKRKKFLGIIVLILLVLLVPLYFDQRWLHIIIMIGLYTMLAGGMRIIMEAGQVSFAHAGFWAVGAYTSTLLVMRFNMSYWIALPLSGLGGGILAIIFGYPLLRLKGPYFFLITLAFGEILRLVFTSWVDVFGGSNGISGIPYPNPIKLPGLIIEFSSRSVHYYYLMLALTIPSLLVYYRLERSRFGLACIAIREHEDMAESLGVNVMRYCMTVFVVACMLAGLAGSFYAHYMTYISPGFFTFNESMSFLLMVIIGGSGSIFGVMIGVIILTLVPEFAREAAQFETIIYGAVLVFSLLFLPGGLWSLRHYLPEKIRSSLVTEEEGGEGKYGVSRNQ